MKAYLLKKIGKPEVLRIINLDEPACGKGQVKVEIKYIGLNYAEILSRKGLYGWAPKRPYVLGMECSGIIVEVGEGVDQNRVGRKVMVGTQFGCYAEKIVIPAEQAIPCIDLFSVQESAAFLVNYLTAWVALFRMARLAKEDSVLITTAAGGVGTAAVQLASKLGCKVYGFAGNEGKLKLIKQLGATDSFNYRSGNCFEKLREICGGVDVIVEMAGGKVYYDCFSVLNPFGRLVVIGYSSLDLKWTNPVSWWQTYKGIPRSPKLMDLAVSSHALMASHLGYLLQHPQILNEVYNELKSFVILRQIKPVISQIFPFEQAAEAHKFIESRKSFGKVLLKV